MVHQSNRFIVRVATSLAVPKMLDYLLFLDAEPQLGSFVEIEVGTKSVHGVIFEIVNQSQNGFDVKKLKEARFLESVPPVSLPMLKFYRWVSRYTMALPGDPIRAALVAGKVPQVVSPDYFLVRTAQPIERLTTARAKVLEAVKSAQYTSQSSLSEASGVGVSVVKWMIDNGVLNWEKMPEEKFSFDIQLPELSSSQAVAAGQLASAVALGAHKPFFLDGVMGSGKTEVYFDTIARILTEDETGQVLLLVPEIALTPQLVQRFEKRFGFIPTLWHSGLSDKARRKNWWQVSNGKARVIIGARSALFLGYQNLKFIVVDEEHDSSYKQEEVFRYHGRDMAVALSHLWACPIVLCSATPSAETWLNVKRGRYEHLMLEGRFAGAKLPAMRLIDMKEGGVGKKDKWLSAPIVDAITQRLDKGEQSLVFLNRRGVAPLLICGGCGGRTGCPSCDASLVVHHSYLICHHCGFSERIPKECPSCGSEKLRPFGPGTRKIKEELEGLFPDARIAVADSDSIRGDKQMGELVTKMEMGDIDILVGTQMVAKGHHFPNLTFVGIVDGDMGLARGELRAAERTFQVLMQVAGRAGREKKAGEVYIQTHDPKHPLFDCLLTCDRDRFLKMELTSRKQWQDPPFSRHVALIVSGKDEREVAQSARLLAKVFPLESGVEILGPAPAPLAKLRDRYRYRLLVKSAENNHSIIQKWLSGTKIPSSIRVVVDVDPVSFY